MACCINQAIKEMIIISPQQNNYPFVVILTALPLEFKAVKDFLSNIQKQTHPRGTIYEVGDFSSGNQKCRVAIVETGQGNINSAISAERSINFFDPSIVLFIGVAGGIKDVKIGDVVIADKIYYYESAKSVEKIKTRPSSYPPSHNLIETAKFIARNNIWLKRIKTFDKPNAFIGPIASGEQVIASTESDIYKRIINNYNDTLAVEMEGYGILSAIYKSENNIKFAVIRGISDTIDNKSQADKEGSQELAAHNASVFAFELLANIINPMEEKMESTDIDIKTVINKSQQEIISILGIPDKIEPGEWRYKGTTEWIPGNPKNYYKNGLIEIKFIENKAVRITINNTESKYPEEVLTYLHLNEKKPSFANEHVFRWSNIDGIYEISAFPAGNGKIFYTYIITEAKYQ